MYTGCKCFDRGDFLVYNCRILALKLNANVTVMLAKVAKTQSNQIFWKSTRTDIFSILDHTLS